jgi:hypothetical protein
MKYIFVVGAPGSKWSSVAKNIYFSPDIDRSDYTEARTYKHHAGVMHMGAYFDPGMEFEIPANIEDMPKEAVEQLFDSPFAGTGVRIIKSHILSNHIDFLRTTWPDCPVVLVYRGDDACLGWWVKCGHFNIKYPCYDYYVDLATMASHIEEQNFNIVTAQHVHDTLTPSSNRELCDFLQIKRPPDEYYQYYFQEDISVAVIR